MTRAILLVDHGSRRAEANQALEQVAALLRERAPGCIVEIAHMELAPPTLAEGIKACVAAGAREIVVHPYFLAAGNHSTRDIPALAREAARSHPDVTVRVSDPLGPHPKLIEVILDRIGEACGLETTD